MSLAWTCRTRGTQEMQRLDRVDSLVPHVRNVEVAGCDRADLLAEPLQCHRVVDHVAAVHLEAERHPVVRSDLPVLAPVREQPLLPLPFEGIAQKRPLGEGHPVGCGIPLGPFGKAGKQGDAPEAGQLHELAGLPELAGVIPGDRFVGHERRPVSPERADLEVMAGEGVEPAVDLSPVGEELREIAVPPAPKSAGTHLYCLESHVPGVLQTFLELELLQVL